MGETAERGLGRKVPSKPFEGFDARGEGTAVSVVNAWSLASASGLAYREEDEVKSQCKEWGFKEVRCFGYGGGGPDTQVYVAVRDDIVVVAYRGTEPSSWRDWVTDLKAVKNWNGPFGSRVHMGFMAGLTNKVDGKCIRDVVEKTLDEVVGNRAVYFTGHSLGAALTTVSAAYVLERGKVPVAGVYTFGSPRVGTRRFADQMMAKVGGRVYRFVNKDDIVPRVPKVLFHHVGQWWYMAGGDQVLTKNPGCWRLFRDRICFDWDFFPDSIADHSILGGYAEGLLKNVKRMYGEV